MNSGLWNRISRCGLPLAGVVLLTGLTQGSRQDRDKVYVAGKDGNRVIGSIKWEIRDEALAKTIGRGEKKVFLEDVSVKVGRTIAGQTPVSKSVALGHHFLLELAGSSAAFQEELTGFALNGERDDMDTFGWDWFQIKAPGKATKLKETGTLGIRVAKIEGKWEVIETRFLTDVSLRIQQRPAQGTRWRIKILKGSKITWPSLVRGKVVANRPK